LLGLAAVKVADMVLILTRHTRDNIVVVTVFFD
jgi:hypothetical protein